MVVGGNDARHPSWHLVVVKSGGNQRFIFGTNKRRLNVGASYIVTRLPAWVEDAIKPHQKKVEVLVCVSGVAELLVEDTSTAQAIIRSVTSTALRNAPGLEVWGWYEPAVPAGLSLSERLNTALRRMEQHRHLLPSPLLRNPMTPFSARCPVTGQPAEYFTPQPSFGDDEKAWLSPQARAEYDVASLGLEAIRNLLTEDTDYAVTKNLDLGVRDNGWVAVVHADGNGFGQMLANLGNVTRSNGETYADLLGAVSNALNDVATTSLQTAVTAVLRKHDASDWLLPLIVGGDDLTAIVTGWLARDFVTEYLRAFEAGSGALGVLRRVAREVLGSDHLTACAGIAIVKPTMPFDQAYTLAEELCASAKTVKTLPGVQVSAFDVQVVHEAAGRSLEEVRRARRGSPAAGDHAPHVVSQLPADDGPGPNGRKIPDDSRTYVTEHQAELLDRAVTALLEDDGLSRSARHRLRTALEVPEPVSQQMRAGLLASVRLSADAATRAFAATLADWLQQHTGPRGLTAIDLAAVEAAEETA